MVGSAETEEEEICRGVFFDVDIYLIYRHFWREYLPRLKYHNPRIPMTVEKISNENGPAKLWVTLSTSSSSSSSAAASSSSSTPNNTTTATSSTTASDTTTDQQTPTQPQPTKEILVTTVDKQESEIFASFIDTIKLGTGEKRGLLKVTYVEPTPDDLVAMKELEDRRKTAEADQKRNRELREKAMAEEELLRRARGEMKDASL